MFTLSQYGYDKVTFNINFRISSYKLENETLSLSIAYIRHNRLVYSPSCCSPLPGTTSLQLEKGEGSNQSPVRDTNYVYC